MKKSQYLFYGDTYRRPKDPHPESPQIIEPYVADEDLIRAVNLAIHLNRPLLLEGEAGCGKTRLAHAVAYELGLPFYRWDIRSVSKAKDGLYTYDAILRLHDVQTVQAGKVGSRNPDNATEYRRFGALGKAFVVQDRPAVVLIDEVDKADIDFPNDLLTVLDEPWAFEIPETGEPTIKAKHKPFVIITSNKEKGNLPFPFLRRCLYYFMEFPNAERLEKIINVHYGVYPDKVPSAELVTNAINKFLALRQEGGLHKKPGTSEFLDWLEALHNFKPNFLEQLTLDGDKFPYPETLFKLRIDWPAKRS